MASSKIFVLDPVLQSPMALAISDEEDLFYVASSSGLHELILSSLKRKKMIKCQSCLDVLFGQLPTTGDKILIATFSLSLDRYADADSCRIFFYSYPNRNEWEPVIEITGQTEWGRIRRLAFSKKLGCLFVSTKHDSLNGPRHQRSSIWKIDIRTPHLYSRFLDKESSSMWYMTVDDKNDFLIVSDMGDDRHHSIDVYNSDNGHYLRTVVSSPNPFPKADQLIGEGSIFWPKGTSIDSMGRLFVVDEKRIQEFDSSNGNFVRDVENLRNHITNAKGMALIEKDGKRRLYIIGKRNKQCILFIIDLDESMQATASSSLEASFQDLAVSLPSGSNASGDDPAIDNRFCNGKNLDDSRESACKCGYCGIQGHNVGRCRPLSGQAAICE